MKKAIKVRLAKGAERMVKKRHPWVFADQIISKETGSTGDLVIIYDSDNKFLAAGLWDAHSPIRVRVFIFHKPEKLDETLIVKRLLKARGRRGVEVLESAGTNGLRYVYGENDDLPGLVIDRYATVAVVKIYAPIWQDFLEIVFDELIAWDEIKTVVFRASNHTLSNGDFKKKSLAGKVVRGDELPTDSIWFQEHNIHLEAAVCQGQKTGFFLDQRENRWRVRNLSKGKRVLNLFSFNGGFSLAALAGGARYALDVDISENALDSAFLNFKKNRDLGVIPNNAVYDSEKADIFEWLKAPVSEPYDIVILDPPALAKKQKDVAKASDAYRWLNKKAIKQVKRGGYLVSASCSAHLSADDFFKIVTEELKKSHRTWTLVEKTGHADDHEAKMSELNYLKAIYIRID